MTIDIEQYSRRVVSWVCEDMRPERLRMDNIENWPDTYARWCVCLLLAGF